MNMSIKKIIAYVLLIIILVPILANSFSIIKLYTTKVYITKAYFTPFYYAKIPAEDPVADIQVFKNHMQKNGWVMTNQMGGRYTFQKGNQKLSVLVRHIKTLFHEK